MEIWRIDTMMRQTVAKWIKIKKLNDKKGKITDKMLI